MISRIYVMPVGTDSRIKNFQKSFSRLNLSGKIKALSIIDSYTVDAEFSPADIAAAAATLTNPILEKYAINQIPKLRDFTSIIEIGFLPGVTDNVGHTAAEMIGGTVYTSKVFLISGTLSRSDLEKITLSLHNPLIERGVIYKTKELRNNGLPLSVPQVVLPKKIPVVGVPLAVSDDELIKIGREGILDESGARRGPLALDLTSMKVIQNYFASIGRDPRDIEIESLAQTWSEHCKHTIFANPIDDIKDGLYKTYIKGATTEIRKQKAEKKQQDLCVSVFSDNAGGIVFDNTFLITHKVETHNSPSALDPYGGAITGIVGVNRDTIGFGLGAKPVANVYGFCFGNPDDTRALFRDKNRTQKMLSPKRIMDGVIKGINAGGNCSGIPTVNGFVKFDDRYRGKPLVFAGTVGLIPRTVNGKPSHEKQAQPGDYVVVVGGRVGADGIHGATFSSVVMDAASPATAVQIGDPITQKKLSDMIVKEARDMDLYSSITDNGAGGISCSVAEMAKECGGAVVDIEKVPLKYPNMQPWQIWISESQERMTLSIPKNKWNVFERLCKSRGVEATVIGEFTDSGNCIVRNNGKVIMDLPLEFLHNGLPKKEMHTQIDQVLFKNPKTPKGTDRTKLLLELLAEGNIAGTAFIAEQYDHEVQSGSVLKPLSGRGRINTDAQVFRPVLASKKGVVLSSSTYPSYSDLSTYDMAACAIDTAVRNAVAAGAPLSHIAILDNFCWCSSNDEKRLGQLVDAVKGCYDYAVGYGTPFISGKDSMFNDFKGYDEKGNPVAISIPPTLLISAIGVMPDVAKVVSPEFKTAGDSIYLLGETNEELGASAYYTLLAKKEKNTAIGNDVPQVAIEKNLKTYVALEKAITKELITSATSLHAGGLAVALAKATVGGMLGCTVSLNGMTGEALSIDAKLFSETQGRILVSVAKQNEKVFEKMMNGVVCAKLGTVTKATACVIKDAKGKKVVATDVKKLFDAYHRFSNRMK